MIIIPTKRRINAGIQWEGEILTVPRESCAHVSKPRNLTPGRLAGVLSLLSLSSLLFPLSFLLSLSLSLSSSLLCVFSLKPPYPSSKIPHSLFHSVCPRHCGGSVQEATLVTKETYCSESRGVKVSKGERVREKEREYMWVCVCERERWSGVMSYRTSLYKLLYSNTHSSFLTSIFLDVLSHLKKII